MSASDGSLPIPAPKGALAALFVGMLCAQDTGSHQLITYRPRMIDTAKLDGLSPPWMRVGQEKSEPSERSRQAADKLASEVLSFASHYAMEALRELRMDSAMASLSCARVEPERELQGQIGVACGLRIGLGAKERFAKVGLPSPSEAAAMWGKCFHMKMSAALRSKRDASAEWSSAPTGAVRSAMIALFEIGMSDEDADKLHEWSPALLAEEERRALARQKPAKARRGKFQAGSASKRL